MPAEFKTDILAVVAERVGSSGPTVLERVIEIMTEEQLKKRVSTLLATMTMADNLVKDIRKIKPDHVLLTEEGSVVSSGYSKQKLEELNKLKAKLAKVEKAINKALETGDYGDINNLGGGD